MGLHKYPPVDYKKSLEVVKDSTTNQGIPRAELFYNFRLSGVPSSRRGHGGIRSGYTVASEQWSLPNGGKLTAFKHSYAGEWKVVPVKPGEDLMSMIQMDFEKNYKEPRLEPFFDTVHLYDSRDILLGSIRLPKPKREVIK